MSAARRLLGLALALLVAGCSTPAGVEPRPKQAVAPMPADWVAQRPHGASAAELTRWWSGFQDPTLVWLIEAAQGESASIAQAGARIAEARESLARAGGARLPSLDAALSRTRGPVSFGGAPFLRTQDLLQFQSSWEIDLFGGLAAARQAERARLAARTAGWHEARVAVAAEVAAAYVALRGCEAQVALERQTLGSRRETEQLTRIAFSAGLQAADAALLARAQTADQAARLQARAADCDLAVKALVALTASAEPALRERLAQAPSGLPAPAAFQVDSLPVQLLAQRPDLASAEAELVAASGDIDAAQARRLPRLALTGAIGPLRFEASGISLSTTNWSFGPTLSLPLFDNGARTAALDSARARQIAAEARYRQAVRQAVREVEEAMVRLASLGQRVDEAARALEDYRVLREATQLRRGAGLGNAFEGEEAHRLWLQGQAVLLGLRQERVLAWIALYRALGGGWTP
ncbi:MAG: efflux transporter outer membrane subunit [Betaproteobacteria bacterium]|nr:efflux transporter outer membrane subunit [Betaproteobacteria bacterium]